MYVISGFTITKVELVVGRALEQHLRPLRLTPTQFHPARRLKVTDEGRAVIVQIVVDFDAELFGADGDLLREELRTIADRVRGSSSALARTD